MILSGGILSNPFGHIAIATTGQGVYSYGTAQYGYGSSATGYINDQLKGRNVSLITLKTTAAQEKTILQAMRAFSGKNYSAKSNNCSDAVGTALGNAGIGEGDVGWSPMLPNAVAGMALGQPGAPAATIMQGGTAPAGLNAFNH